MCRSRKTRTAAPTGCSCRCCLCDARAALLLRLHCGVEVRQCLLVVDVLRVLLDRGVEHLSRLAVPPRGLLRGGDDLPLCRVHPAELVAILTHPRFTCQKSLESQAGGIQLLDRLVTLAGG